MTFPDAPGRPDFVEGEQETAPNVIPENDVRGSQLHLLRLFFDTIFKKQDSPEKKQKHRDTPPPPPPPPPREVLSPCCWAEGEWPSAPLW